MIRVTFAAATAAALTACASPPPRVADVSSGRVATANVARMTDCVADGFREAVPLFVHIQVQQERRADAVRVESTVDAGVLIYADIGDDGTATLVETSRAKLIGTSGNRQAFAECLARYAAPST